MNIASAPADAQDHHERALAPGDAATFPSFHADVASITRGVDRRSGGRSRPRISGGRDQTWKAPQ